MKYGRQFSPLLRFKAKSELAEFSKPIEIPKRLEPLDLNSAQQRGYLTSSNAFVQRSYARYWVEEATPAIYLLRDSYLTDQQIMRKYFIPEDDVERMERLRELMCDKDDFVFGDDGLDGVSTNVAAENAIFRCGENIDETEMHIMAFNEAICAIGEKMPNTAGALSQIRNFFIYKVKEKNRMQKSLEETARELDYRCFQSLQDVASMYAELAELNKCILGLNGELDKEKRLSAQLRAANLKHASEKEQLSNVLESTQRQNFYLAADMKMREREKEELNSRARRLQAGVNRYREISDAAQEKIAVQEKRIKQLEASVEDAAAELNALKLHNADLQTCYDKQFEEIAQLQKQLDEGFSREVRKAPEDAPDPVKMAVMALIELSQKVQYDKLVADFGLEMYNLVCARNLIVAIKDSDYIQDVVNAANGMCAEVMEYRTVGIQVSTSYPAQIITQQIVLSGSPAARYKTKEEIYPQAQVTFSAPEVDALAEQTFQNKVTELNRIIDKLKRENMNLSTKCAQFRKENEDLAKTQLRQAREELKTIYADSAQQQVTNINYNGIQYLSNSSSQPDSPNDDTTSAKPSARPLVQLYALEQFGLNNNQSEEMQKPLGKAGSRPRKSVKRDREQVTLTYHFSVYQLVRHSINLSVANIVKIEFQADDLYYFSNDETSLRSVPASYSVSLAKLPTATIGTSVAVKKYQEANSVQSGVKQIVAASASNAVASKDAVSADNAQEIYSKVLIAYGYNTGNGTLQEANLLNMDSNQRLLLSYAMLLQEPESNDSATRSVLSSFLSWLGYECRLWTQDNVQPSGVDKTKHPFDLTKQNFKSSASLLLQKPKHHYQVSDLLKFYDSMVFSATQADILDQMNEVVRSLPPEMRYETKISLNNALFKHIDHYLNKKNFNYFYEKYHELLEERSPVARLADSELTYQVAKFIEYATTVKTVQKQDTVKTEDADNSDMDLLDPRAPATSKYIANYNKIIQRQQRILYEFAVDSKEVAQMSELLFYKYLANLKTYIAKRKERAGAEAHRRYQYITDVSTDVAPTKTIEELKRYAQVEMCDFSINVDFLDTEPLPFQSDALQFGQYIKEANEFVNKALEQKVENFVPPREHKQYQTEESAVTTDKALQTDTAIDDFLQDAYILYDMKKMMNGDPNDFSVAYIKGMDDNEQALIDLDDADLVPEANIPSSLLSRKVRYNNLIYSSQVVSRAQDDLFASDTGSRGGAAYVENTTIEDGIKDYVKTLQREAERLRVVKERSAVTAQSMYRSSVPQISQVQSIHFQKGLEQGMTSSYLQNSYIIPPIQQRNSVRYGHLAAHKLDYTSIDSKYSIAASKLIIDQNDIMRKLKSIESSMPSYQDFLRLVKTAQAASTIETAQTVLQSNLDIHPRYGEFTRYSQKSIISPPINDYFVIQHPVDKVYLKYCPADGDVVETTMFYPAVIEGFEDIERYYEYHQTASNSEAAQAPQFQQLYACYQNTRKYFKYSIDVATFYQHCDPPPELRRAKTLMPYSGTAIKYVRLSALTYSTKGYKPGILTLLEDIYMSPTQQIMLGYYMYIKLPIYNVALKSLNWTLKLIKTLVADRMAYTYQLLATTTSETASTFVTAAADARKVRFTVVPGNLQRREAESVACYFVQWAMKKYGVRTIVSQLAWNFIVNLAYYQYENAEIYLFARMFFEDLEPDYFLFYLELRRILDLRSRQETVVEMISTKTIPSVVATTLKNWEPKRQYAFVQNVFSILYSKQDDNQFTVPNVMEFYQFCYLILYAYGMFRRTAFQQAGLVFNHLAKEYGTGALLGEAGFRQLCQVLVPYWSTNTVSEVFYAFSAGQNTTDLSQRRMAMANLQELFISMQLGRFSGVSADILEQTVGIELKKLIKSAAFVFEQMAVVAKQIIQVLMRHAALKNGEKYIKYTKILKCYVDVIYCDIMAFDFVNALANMKLVLSTIVEGLLEIIPDACIVAIGGSMTALKNYFSLFM